MKKVPQIRQYMTNAPHSIEPKVLLPAAAEFMRLQNVRHLPVQMAGKLIGILSERNVKVALSVPHGERLTVEDVMIPKPFCVPPYTPLDEVAAEMASEKFGCAVVQEEDGTLVGIFTTVDACRALREVLAALRG